MRHFIQKTFGKLLWIAVLPFVTGCGGGGGLAFLGLGSLFGLGGAGGSLFLGGSGGSLALLGSSSGSIPVLHNPEPTSMLLLGSGLAAMAFYKSRKKS